MEHTNLNASDVVASDNKSHPFHAFLGMSPTFRIQEVREKMRNLIMQANKFDINQTLKCQVLQSDKSGWRSGTVQIKD